MAWRVEAGRLKDIPVKRRQFIGLAASQASPLLQPDNALWCVQSLVLIAAFLSVYDILSVKGEC